MARSYLLLPVPLVIGVLLYFVMPVPDSICQYEPTTLEQCQEVIGGAKIAPSILGGFATLGFTWLAALNRSSPYQYPHEE